MLNLLEVASMPATVADYFTAVGQTVSGLIGSSVKVFEQLWLSGAPGQVICTLGIATTCIVFATRIFNMSTRKKAAKK